MGAGKEWELEKNGSWKRMGAGKEEIHNPQKNLYKYTYKDNTMVAD